MFLFCWQMQSQHPSSAVASAQGSHVQRLKDLMHIQDQVRVHYDCCIMMVPV